MPHLAEKGLENLLPAQIVGGFGAAVQDNPQIGDMLFKILVNLDGPLRAGPRQRTSREENRIAPLRQRVIGVPPGNAPSFIIQETFMCRKGCDALFNGFPAQVQKQGSRIQIHRADAAAKPAEGAFKGQSEGGVAVKIQPSSDGFGVPMLGQKSTLPLTKRTLNTSLQDIFKP
jgi:hypothetical protein